MDYREKHRQTLVQEKEQMIRERTIQEQEFERVKNMLLNASPKYKEVIPEDLADWSLRKFIPEWYKEMPDKDIAEQQRLEFNEKLESINIALFTRQQEIKEESNRIYEGAGANGS